MFENWHWKSRFTTFRAKRASNNFIRCPNKFWMIMKPQKIDGDFQELKWDTFSVFKTVCSWSRMMIPTLFPIHNTKSDWRDIKNPEVMRNDARSGQVSWLFVAMTFLIESRQRKPTTQKATLSGFWEERYYRVVVVVHTFVLWWCVIGLMCAFLICYAASNTLRIAKEELTPPSRPKGISETWAHSVCK